MEIRIRKRKGGKEPVGEREGKRARSHRARDRESARGVVIDLAM